MTSADNRASVCCCAECENFHHEAPQHDQPYPEFQCGKGYWEGIQNYDELYEPTKCLDFEKTVEDERKNN